MCLSKCSFDCQLCRLFFISSNSNFVFFSICFAKGFIGHVPANERFIERETVPCEKTLNPLASVSEKRKLMTNKVLQVTSSRKMCFRCLEKLTKHLS